MSEVVLDASALLALLHREPGHEEVADTIPHAAISSVNLSEVVAKLAENGMPEAQVREALAGLALDVHDFDAGDAFRAGFLRPATKEKGLSFGDRACLALGAALHLHVLTADRTWQSLDSGVRVHLIR